MSQRVLVAGASRGIGLALVRALLDRGDEVWAGVRHVTPELDAIASARLRVLTLDVSSVVSVSEAASACGAESLDVVIANAAVNGGPQHAPGMDLERVARVIDTNAVGPVRLYDAFIERVRKARGVWVNVSSEAGSLSRFRASSKPEYAMSKAALNAFTRWAASVEKDVRVISLDPGWTQTAMGGANATYSTGQTAERMLAVIDRLGGNDHGRFVDCEGRDVGW
jgi:NAD(P)-dependent dehydrogenase (short-subunit alcohol dehydrogenase family)